ncbi:unnamed protein product [Ectocarpus sp. 12 AP-2014]
MLLPRRILLSLALLAPLSKSADAFTVPSAAAAAPAAASPRPKAPRRLLILPDARADLSNPDCWHYHLKANVVVADKDVEVTIEDMPDPYSFNTKRYETLWLNFMADELELDPGTLVVAHGTAADAVLRFVEKYEVWGAVLVCPGGEMYHAGERHGRAYVWPAVRRSCPWLAIVHGIGDPIMGEAEAGRMKGALGVPPRLFREADGGQQRLRDRTGSLPEVEELVLSAF